jgi:hypothetical protein
MKYNCPSSSTWKLAIECFFRILKVGLVVARKHRRNITMKSSDFVIIDFR